MLTTGLDNNQNINEEKHSTKEKDYPSINNETKSSNKNVNQKIKVVLIGAAGKKGSDYLNALLKRDDIEIAAVVLNNTVPDICKTLEKKGTKIFFRGDVKALLATTDFDIAVVCVPHEQHDVITRALLGAGKYVVKEKPLALLLSQVEDYKALIHEKNIFPIFTTVQRDTFPSFIKAREDLHLIGKPREFFYDYSFNLPTVTTGWRSKKETAGGGVIMDMGYHAIDVIVKFFSCPDKISAAVDYKYKETREEGLEDSAKISMEYSKINLHGHLTLNRHATEKNETFRIVGTDGSIIVTPQSYKVFNNSGKLLKGVDCAITKEEEIVAMLKYAIPYHENSQALSQAFNRNVNNVEMINRIYLSLKPVAKKQELQQIKVQSSPLCKFGIHKPIADINTQKQLSAQSLGKVVAEYCGDSVEKEASKTVIKFS